jgi:hypothetical protein
MTRVWRLLLTAAATAMTVGLSALPAHAGLVQNHNETLLRGRG